VKAEEDEVWDTMETVTEKTKKRAAQNGETTVDGVDGKKKRKLVKNSVKWFIKDFFLIILYTLDVMTKTCIRSGQKET